MSNVPNNVIINQDAPNQVVVNQSAPNNVIINEDSANQVIVNQDAPNQVVVRLSAPASSNTRRYVHIQEQASSTWTIAHTLGGRPSVTVVDSAGTVVYGEVQYLSDTQVSVLFSAGFSGYAYLT